MRGRPRGIKKESTLKKEVITSRRKVLKSHEEQTKLITSIFNTLLNKKISSEFHFQDSFFKDIARILQLELSEKRENYLRLHFFSRFDSSNLHQTVKQFIIGRLVLEKLTREQLILVELYELKNGKQLMLFLPDYIADRLEHFTTHQYEQHPSFLQMEKYRKLKLRHDKYVKKVNKILTMFSSLTDEDAIVFAQKQKAIFLRRRYLEQPVLSDSRLEKAVKEFIYKAVLPFITIYLLNLQSFDYPILKVCKNPKCGKIFPTFSRRFHANTCSKICTTELNRT